MSWKPPGEGTCAEILEELGDATPVYVPPLVVAVKDGEVSGSHLSTVDSQLNSFEPLTTAQRNELSALYACLFARAS